MLISIFRSNINISCNALIFISTRPANPVNDLNQRMQFPRGWAKKYSLCNCRHVENCFFGDFYIFWLIFSYLRPKHVRPLSMLLKYSALHITTSSIYILENFFYNEWIYSYSRKTKKSAKKSRLCQLWVQISRPIDFS